MRSAEEYAKEACSWPMVDKYSITDHVARVIRRAQTEALEEAVAEASGSCGCCTIMLDAIESLIPPRDTKDKIVDTLKEKESS
jgi:hypothetical protein